MHHNIVIPYVKLTKSALWQGHLHLSRAENKSRVSVHPVYLAVMQIPSAPDSLVIDVTSLWNGSPCSDASLHAEVRIQQSPLGLNIVASAPQRSDAHIPDAAPGRLDGLWNFDVVEVFLAGETNYLEIELGAGGHWLVLEFDGIRQRSNEYVDFEPVTTHAVRDQRWESGITVPWNMIPSGLARMNAFAIAGGQFLALHAVPGTEPDFHQPQSFPAITL